jgi:hypothetical protein
MATAYTSISTSPNNSSIVKYSMCLPPADDYSTKPRKLIFNKYLTDETENWSKIAQEYLVNQTHTQRTIDKGVESMPTNSTVHYTHKFSRNNTNAQLLQSNSNRPYFHTLIPSSGEKKYRSPSTKDIKFIHISKVKNVNMPSIPKPHKISFGNAVMKAAVIYGGPQFKKQNIILNNRHKLNVGCLLHISHKTIKHFPQFDIKISERINTGRLRSGSRQSLTINKTPNGALHSDRQHGLKYNDTVPFALLNSVCPYKL